MLRTRLWMGAILIALVAGVLVVDQWLAPWYPFLFVLVLGLALLACYELLHLLGAEARPAPWLCYLAVAALVVANWLPRGVSAEAPDPWYGITSVFVAAALAAFLVEMAAFQAPLSPAGG